MLGKLDLRFVTPQSVAELASHRVELQFLFKFIPGGLSDSQVWEFCEASVPNVTIAYLNDVLIGCFALDVFTRSVELHGVVRPDIRTIVPKSNRVKQWIYEIIFEMIFKTMDRERVVLKAPPTNRDVWGFAVMHGFKKLQYPDKGETVYVLSREDYQRRKSNGKKQTTDG